MRWPRAAAHWAAVPRAPEAFWVLEERDRPGGVTSGGNTGGSPGAGGQPPATGGAAQGGSATGGTMAGPQGGSPRAASTQVQEALLRVVPPQAEPSPVQVELLRVVPPPVASRRRVVPRQAALQLAALQPAVRRPAEAAAPTPSPGRVTFMQQPARQHPVSLPTVLPGFFIARTPGPFTRSGKAARRVARGGTTQDIGTIAGGFADSATQDTFCGTTTCTFSLLYDQSGKGNNIKVAPAGCYTGGNASSPDYESNANHSITISGHKVYSLYMNPQDGYRNDTPSGMPTGTAAQGIYEVADGTRTNNTACCWDFGNASVNNCNQGTMDAIYFGTGYWGSGTGNGPWFMADFEGGVWAGGTGASNVNNPALPSSKIAYAFGILKTDTSGYEIRVGNAQSGTLVTANNTGLPKTLNSPGGIILGIGGDNSNSSGGTFYEGVITSGKPSDATDALVLTNVQSANYGQ